MEYWRTFRVVVGKLDVKDEQSVLVRGPGRTFYEDREEVLQYTATLFFLSRWFNEETICLG